MKISKFNLSYLFEISKFIIANICLVRYQKNLKILKLVKFLRTIFQNFQSHEYHEGQKNPEILKSEFRRLYFKIVKTMNITPQKKNSKILKDSQNSISRLSRENYILKFSKLRISRLIGIGMIQKLRISHLTRMKKI